MGSAKGKAAPTHRVFLRTWGSRGSADAEFCEPRGVAVCMDGTIIVSDHANCRLQCFRPNGEFVQKWGKKGEGDGEFRWPRGVAIGVGDGINALLTKTMMSIPQVQALPPGLLPICAAYIGEECVYVVDTFNNRIQVFGTDGRYRRKWGSCGEGDGQFRRPLGCCVDKKNDVIYVADTENHRIQAFRDDGTFLLKWGTYGKGAQQFDFPTSVAASDTGLIYVSDTSNNRVVRYHNDGTLDGAWTVRAFWPSGLVIDEDGGVIYIMEARNHRVLQCRIRDRVVLQNMGAHGSGDGRFHHPWYITRGADGVLYVTDGDNHRVVAMRMD